MAVMEWHRLVRSFSFAIAGIANTVKTERNMQIHLAAAVLALTATWWLDVPLRDGLLVLFAIALVFGLELVNTAIEAVVDLTTPEWHAKAKVAKDAAAGAVLVAACSALLIGLAVLGPPLYHKIWG